MILLFAAKIPISVAPNLSTYERNSSRRSRVVSCTSRLRYEQKNPELLDNLAKFLEHAAKHAGGDIICPHHPPIHERIAFAKEAAQELRAQLAGTSQPPSKDYLLEPRADQMPF